MSKHRYPTPDEDTPLLLSWHRGDTSAFETLVWKYQKRIFNIALLLTGTEKNACEVTENTFVTTFHNIRSLKSTGRFSSWLLSIALKECRELQDFQPEGNESVEGDNVSTDGGANYPAAIQKKIELCIRALPFELSELILLRYVRGYSVERIVEILQISIDHLLSRLFEAEQTLACWLKSDTESPAEFCGLRNQSTSTHPEIRRTFTIYLDNSGEEEEKAITKAHLKSCGSCREALAELEWMITDIKSLPDYDPPHWLAASILSKVKSAPSKPFRAEKKSHFKIQLAAALSVFTVIVLISYTLLKGDNAVIQLPQATGKINSLPVPAKNTPPPETGLASVLRGVFKGSAPTSDRTPRPEGVVPSSPPSVPLPAAVPSEQPVQEPRSSKPAQPATTDRVDPAQKREKPEAPQASLQEWGDPPPPTRTPPKTQPQQRNRGGEMEVLLSTADSVAAAHEIELAVISTGGKINGRAFSNGSDILYTVLDADRFFDLMNKLRKIGRIQELPQPPQNAEGNLDLIIRW